MHVFSKEQNQLVNIYICIHKIPYSFSLEFHAFINVFFSKKKFMHSNIHPILKKKILHSNIHHICIPEISYIHKCILSKKMREKKIN